MKTKSMLLFCIVFNTAFAFAEDKDPMLKLDLPLFDLPYQMDAMNTVGHGFFSSYANPSMAQSMAVTTDMYSAFHYGMRTFYDSVNMNRTLKEIIYYGGIAMGDFLLTYMPGGDGWLHEEFHRAVMSRRRVNSFNGMNLFPLGAEMVSVSKVSDEDLVRFKAESPADFIRMHEVGIEGQYLLASRLQRNNFFYNQNYFNEWLYWTMTLNSHLYVLSSASPAMVNAQTEQMNKAETDAASRDFTGFDMTAWVYDLFRPNEPYQDRGIHPSGIGVNRYRTTEDLTDDELNYLTMQGWLQLFNYLSPMMLGFRSLPFGDTDITWNFAFRHFLTSFGSDVTLELLINSGELNFVAAYHNYQSYEHIFPAIEIEMIDYPVRIKNVVMYISPKIMAGVQPKRQAFFTSEAEFFGLAGSRIDFQITKHWLPYIEVMAKTNGWVAGNEFLENNISARLGVSARF
ncbi:MAG: hypothetical protein LBF60_04865 [Treponema sp.]|jgi:hypothetical protein|nr:hypothetical protein [Treponema sp.]